VTSSSESPWELLLWTCRITKGQRFAQQRAQVFVARTH
jgi:hypothetical protein